MRRSMASAGRSATGVMVGLLACALVSCSAQTPQRGADPIPSVVASTDVWGSVAQAVAGDDAEVTSIITSGSADPHSFEASPSDAAKIADASIVVFNGGGYDPWVRAVLDNHPDIPAVEAYALLDTGTDPGPAPANEHVFYDVATVKSVASELATRLAAADPGNAGDYRSRADEFGRRTDEIRAAQQSVADQHRGASVVATEPVAYYLLRAVGLVDKTPPGFTSAVEQDTDPAPVDVAAVLDLISGRQVTAVIFNDQTVTEATRRVRRSAEDAGVPVVAVTETLPAGADYLNWQTDTVNRLASALRESR